MGTYIELFENLKTYVFDNRENKRNTDPFNPVCIHCDFGIGLIGEIKQIWPNSEIKLCLWHFYRNIETNRKKYLKMPK